MYSLLIRTVMAYYCNAERTTLELNTFCIEVCNSKNKARGIDFYVHIRNSNGKVPLAWSFGKPSGCLRNISSISIHY